MRTLGRTFTRFEEWFTTEAGLRFQGSRQTSKEGVSGLSNFLETREILHTRIKSPAQFGDVVTDPRGRRFILADHDVTSDVRVFKLFRVTDQVTWTRKVTSIDPITQLPKSGVPQNLGPVWVAMELYGRSEVDRAMHVQRERSRVLCGQPLQLEDVLDDRVVRRVYKVYGISVAEIQ